jgi:3-oxoacyl-[acyl-carrier-protein] synthase-3
VLAKASHPVNELSVVIPHLANVGIIEAVAKRLEVPMEKFYVNIQDYGNTGSASVGLALWEARKKGKVKRGDLVLLTAFGAGFHWAAVLLQF